MSYITTSKILTVGTRPVFLGWLDQWIYTDDPVELVQTPLQAADVSEILFSLEIRTKVVTGFNAAEMVFTPVEEYQNVPIGNERIKPLFQFDQEFFQKMLLPPMQANFIYIPDNIPPLFATPGTYLARFDFITADGGDEEIHPQTVELTVW